MADIKTKDMKPKTVKTIDKDLEAKIHTIGLIVLFAFGTE